MTVANSHGVTSRNYNSLSGIDAEAEFTAHPGLDIASEFYLADDWHTGEDTFSTTVETSLDDNLTYCHNNGAKGMILRFSWGEDAPTWPTYGETVRLLNRDNHVQKVQPVADDTELRRVWLQNLRHLATFLKGTCPGGGHTRAEHYTAMGLGFGGHDNPEMNQGYSFASQPVYQGAATLANGMNTTQTFLLLAGDFSAYPTGAATLVIDPGGSHEQWVGQKSRSGNVVTLYADGTDGYNGRAWNNAPTDNAVLGETVKYAPTTSTFSTTYDGKSGEFDEYLVNLHEWDKIDTVANLRTRYKTVWRDSLAEIIAVLGDVTRSDGSHLPIVFSIGALWGDNVAAADQILIGDTAYDGTGTADVFGSRVMNMVTSYEADYSSGDTFEDISANLFDGLQKAADHGSRISAQNRGVPRWPSNPSGINDYVYAGETYIGHLPGTVWEPQPARLDEGATQTSAAQGGYAGYTSDNVEKYLGADAVTPARSDNLGDRLYGALDEGDDFEAISDETTITTANTDATAVTIDGGTLTADTAQGLDDTVSVRYDISAGAGDTNLRYTDNIDSKFVYLEWTQRWESFDTGQDSRLMRFRNTGNIAFVGYHATTKYLQIRDSAGTVIATGTVALQVDTDYRLTVSCRAGTSSDGRLFFAVYDGYDTAVPVDTISVTGQSFDYDTITRVDLGAVGKGAGAAAHKFWIGAVHVTDHGFDTFRYGDPAAPIAETFRPSPAAVVAGTYEIRAYAFDAVTAQASLTVEVSIDGAGYTAMSWDAANGWHDYQWDTTAETNTTHTIDVRATDAAGHTAPADQITVTVTNTGSVAVGVATETGLALPITFGGFVTIGTATEAGLALPITPTPFVGLSIAIDGTPVRIVADTLDVDATIEERSVATFTVETDTSVTIVKGDDVTIRDGADIQFTGLVETVDVALSAPDPIRYHNVTAIDWHIVADRRIVAASYQDQDTGSIVEDIVSGWLSADGVTVTAGSVEEGVTVEQAVFNYVPASQALQSLADLSGFSWWIDTDKVLHFVPRTAYVAPWTVTWEDAVTPRLLAGNTAYRNRQYIIGGQDVTDTQIESYKGDGEAKTFTVGYPIVEVPAITVDTVAETVGIRGVDTGKDWYWNKGSTLVTQDIATTPLTSSNTLKVTYKGTFDMVIISVDQAEVDRIAALDGTSGSVDALVADTTITSRQAGFQVAASLLTKYAQDGETLSFSTIRSGIQIGQLLTVDLEELGAVGDYLVTQVTLQDQAGVVAWYHIQAVTGPFLGSWVRFFDEMSQVDGRQIRENISEAEILVVLTQHSESWGWVETVTPSVAACPVVATTLYPLTTLYPC